MHKDLRGSMRIYAEPRICFFLLEEIFILLVGYDVILQTQSGTGKTIPSIIAILQRINLDIKSCQALILTPMGELAQAVWLFPEISSCYRKVLYSFGNLDSARHIDTR